MRTEQRLCYGCGKRFRNIGDTLTIISYHFEGEGRRGGTPASWCEKCTARLDHALEDHLEFNTDARSRGQQQRYLP